MNVLVTGGAGFIGSNLVDALVGRGHEVRVLDNFSTGRWKNLEAVRGEIEIVEGDLCELASVRRAVSGISVVFHQGALPSPRESVENPIRSDEVNARGTLNVLMAARDAGVARVVYASSCALYGDNPDLPKREDMPPEPLSPYAAAKLAGEGYCRVFSEVYGLETVSLRYFNVFGPRQDPTSEYAAVIPNFATAMLRSERPTIYGDGRQSRDFIHVSDVVRANLLAAEVDGVAGEVVNVACGEERDLLELVAALNRILGTDIRPIHDNPRLGDVRHSRADVSKARQLLGFEPEVGFERGVHHIVDWYREAMNDFVG